ncbi:MAG: hypothetical protein IKD27_03130 [Oscillospiraceae bacterium]|nr:hypothetical protein [Oscillospiraceae bacterium]
MKKTVLLILTALMLILDSRTAAAAASDALELCIRTLIPSLFPLFVVSAMLVPGLKSIRIPWLARLLGFPDGSEGLFLLGCAGGFPVGAACVSQAVQSGNLDKRDAERMLGLVSFCGPSFLFGVIGHLLGMKAVCILFLIQLESSVLLASFWPGHSESRYISSSESITLPAAVHRSFFSMATVCAWVVLASVAAGFAERWVFPYLPAHVGILLTGLLELTNGVFALSGQSPQFQFLLCAVFICFGGVSVLLQIAALAAPAGLSVSTCITQKTVQAILAGILAAAYLTWGWFAILLPVFVKGALAFSGPMVYNVRGKEGI